MRWFTDAAYESEPDEWDRMLLAYKAHVASIAFRLPADVAALATDPRLDLHDARFREVVVDPAERRIEMTIESVDELGHSHLLTLRFGDATIVPGDLQLLGFAIRATFGGPITEIRAQEVDILADDRFVLRLRLWPFHEFAIEFAEFSLGEAPLKAPRRQRPGRYIVRPRE